MKAPEYQALAIRTAKMFQDLEKDLNHAVLGIVSETGELAETVNAIWMDLPPKEGQSHQDNMKEEIGDASWYPALACTIFGWKFEDLIIADQQHVRELDFALFKASSVMSPVAVHECMTGFAGELATQFKALYVYGKPLNEDKFKKYLSLFVTATAMLCEINQIEYADALEYNIAKLRKRFPNAYSDADALARADKAA